ncbi:MAG: VWA domain-containing protein [Acidobacteria bacterium]|nr:VWA domain-containing protein [Acidobacteriota bacterium]
MRRRRFVRVDAQVMDGARVVPGLTRNDFLLYDNNQPVTLTYFEQEREPLTLLLVLDVSGSMSRFLEQLSGTARSAMKSLKPGDQIGILPFSRNSRVAAEFTPDKDRVADLLRTAIRDRSLGSGTQINHALRDAAKYFDEKAPPAGRRALLIVTDNLGVNYQLDDQTVIRALHDANVVCNAIIVGKGRRPGGESKFRNPEFTYANVFDIAENTGGDILKSDNGDEALARILERIRSRYSMHYLSPGGEPGTFREIRVELSAQAKARYPKAAIRNRRGYTVR